MESIDFEKQYERDVSGLPLLVLRCGSDFTATQPMQLLADVPIAELCEAVAPAGVSAADFADPRARLLLVNGWQSWSFAGELGGKERPRRAILKPALNLYVDHPAEREVRALAGRGHPGLRHDDIVSHFYLVLRAARARLALVSHNAGSADGERSLPPVTFFVGRESVRIAVFAEGGSFRAGEVVASIAIAAGSDYFGLKDRLARLFGAAGRQGSRREPIGGFETWYNHYLDIDEGIIRRDLEALGTNDNLVNAMFLEKGKPLVFQIDDGWEECVGDWVPRKDKFPDGVASLAARMEGKGLIPGLWLAPFLVMPGSAIAREHPGWLLRHEGGQPVLAGWNPGWGGNVYCLDLSLSEVEDYLVSLFDAIVNEWGFRYLKLDFLYAGMLRGTRGGEAGGIWEHYARVLKRITSMRTTASGLPVTWLACGAPIESTAPLIPLMRIGADTREHWDWPLLRLIGHQGRPSAKVNLGHTLARSLLDGTALLNDPDVVFCRTERTSLADSEKFLIGLVARMFASQIMISDDPAEFGLGRNGGASKGVGGLTDRDFTRELLVLYEKLGNRDFGVERYSLSSPDLYRFFSRDGELHGLINLSDRSRVLEAESPSGETKPALLPPHSMVIFGLP